MVPFKNLKFKISAKIDDDPIFSVPGDIAMNWRYHNNGVRIALTGGHLSDEDSDDDKTHGLGTHLSIDWINKIEMYPYKIWMEEQGLLCHFLKTEKKCPDFGIKCPV